MTWSAGLPSPSSLPERADHRLRFGLEQTGTVARTLTGRGPSGLAAVNDCGRREEPVPAQRRGQGLDECGEQGAGPAQSRRGLGLVLRSTATSCRRTRSSTSLADDVRPSTISSSRGAQIQQAQRRCRSGQCCPPHTPRSTNQPSPACPPAHGPATAPEICETRARHPKRDTPSRPPLLRQSRKVDRPHGVSGGVTTCRCVGPALAGPDEAACPAGYRSLVSTLIERALASELSCCI